MTRSLRCFDPRPGWSLGLLLVLSGCGSLPPSASNNTQFNQAAPSLIATEQAQDVTIRALGLVGTPYRFGGNTPQSGFDCSGLIAYVYQNQISVKTPRTVAQLQNWGRSIPTSELRSGDLVLFSHNALSAPHHAGIYVGDKRFVHAPSTGGDVRLDQLGSPYWSSLTVTYRRP